jgi:N-acetyl sugar amidotransferase
MDDSIAPIHFDADGRCVCCRSAAARMPFEYFPNAEGERRLAALVSRLKEEGRGRSYDCLIGLSGGIDSAYLAHVLITRFGLRVLAVHVDGGWNSEAAVHNIETICRALDIDLYTYVVEWNEMRDVQLAFLRSGVLNQDMPQDHAFFATLYRVARERGIRSFLSGVNFATECVGQSSAGYPSIDGRHVRSIHAKFGQGQLSSYPIMTLASYLWTTRILQTPVIYRPLDLISYDKSHAKATLRRLYQWKDYGGKHSESRFTKFYQEIYLLRKTGFDKRRLHLSSLIVSGQLTRHEALAELDLPLVNPNREKFDLIFVAKKLGISVYELEELIERPLVSHNIADGDSKIFAVLARARAGVRKIASMM